MNFYYLAVLIEHYKIENLNFERSHSLHCHVSHQQLPDFQFLMNQILILFMIQVYRKCLRSSEKVKYSHDNYTSAKKSMVSTSFSTWGTGDWVVKSFIVNFYDDDFFFLGGEDGRFLQVYKTLNIDFFFSFFFKQINKQGLDALMRHTLTAMLHS